MDFKKILLIFKKKSKNPKWGGIIEGRNAYHYVEGKNKAYNQRQKNKKEILRFKNLISIFF
jgi:hypothetical protein